MNLTTYVFLSMHASPRHSSATGGWFSNVQNKWFLYMEQTWEPRVEPKQAWVERLSLACQYGDSGGRRLVCQDASWIRLCKASSSSRACYVIYRSTSTMCACACMVVCGTMHRKLLCCAHMLNGKVGLRRQFHKASTSLSVASGHVFARGCSCFSHRGLSGCFKGRLTVVLCDYDRFVGAMSPVCAIKLVTGSAEGQGGQKGAYLAIIKICLRNILLRNAEGNLLKAQTLRRENQQRSHLPMQAKRPSERNSEILL